MISDTVICTVNEYSFSSFSIFVALNYNNAWWQGHIIQLFHWALETKNATNCYFVIESFLLFQRHSREFLWHWNCFVKP